jgi:hypothetical protein
MSMPLGQIAPPSAVTALGLRITCYIKIVKYVTLKRQYEQQAQRSKIPTYRSYQKQH